MCISLPLELTETDKVQDIIGCGPLVAEINPSSVTFVSRLNNLGLPIFRGKQIKLNTSGR